MVTALDTMYVRKRWPALSAYNGAALYPIKEIVRTGARYDAGGDGQRCEHVGFHLAITEQADNIPGRHSDPLEGQGAVSLSEAEADGAARSPLAARGPRYVQVAPLWTVRLHPLRPAGPTKQRFVGAVAKTNSDSVRAAHLDIKRMG